MVHDEFRRNWCSNLEYGYWSPEILNKFSIQEGWFKSYETIEADLWALGLVFLESMVL